MIEQSFKDWLALNGPKFKKETVSSYVGRLRKYEKYYGQDLSSLNGEQLINALKETFYNPMREMSTKRQTDVRSAIRKYIEFRRFKITKDSFSNLEFGYIDWLMNNGQVYSTASSNFSRLNRLFRVYALDAKKLDVKDINDVFNMFMKSSPQYINSNQIANVKRSLISYIDYKKSNA